MKSNYPLTEAAVKEFQEIYEEEFKEKISFDEARITALKLLTLIKAIYKPIPRK